ncbi:MAG: PLP-dependent aminotransferase family protein [Christensenellaceae bacterium]
MMYEFSSCFEGVTGSEIRKIFALLADPQIISFAGGNPSPDTFPAEELAQISDEIIKNDARTVLQYGGTLGMPSLIELLKQRNAGIMKKDDEIIVLTGSSQGISLFSTAMLNKGDRILVESPTFLGALQTFLVAGADIKSVRMQDDGVVLEDLEQKIIDFAPKFFYVIPTFQNPMGITTSEQKRQEIYRLCKKHGVLILEDDPYAELRYEGQALPSIKSYDDCGLVCKLSSFSKTISPGLRVGYAIANKEIIEKFNLLKQGADVHTSNLTQALVYEYIKRGRYEQHIEILCAEYTKKRDAMMRAIKQYFPNYVRYTNPQGGLFLWVTLPKNFNARELFAKCVEKKVAFVVGAPFYTAQDTGHDNTLRLNFSMPSIENINIGIERMGAVIRAYEGDLK